MGQIKVILWDIDGTILNFEEAEKAAIRTCFSIYCKSTCTDEMLAVYSGINRGYWKRIEKGEISRSEALEGRFKDWLKAYGLDASVAADFNKEYQVRLGDTVCFYPNALETVKALKGKVPQYAVTNGTKVAQERKLCNSGLMNLLDGVFISEDVGVDKPSVEYFERVFEKIGPYEKEEMLIVGDSLTSDMQGGNNAGIVTCWFNPEKKEPEKELRIDHEICDLSEVLKLV